MFPAYHHYNTIRIPPMLQSSAISQKKTEWVLMTRVHSSAKPQWATYLYPYNSQHLEAMSHQDDKDTTIRDANQTVSYGCNQLDSTSSVLINWTVMQYSVKWNIRYILEPPYFEMSFIRRFITYYGLNAKHCFIMSFTSHLLL